MDDTTVEFNRPRVARLPRPFVYALAAVVASQLALTLASSFLAYSAIHESERRWCGTLGVFHRSYQQNPPTTPAGQDDIRRQLDKLYDQFGCSTVDR